MSTPYDTAAAIAVLPAVRGGRLRDRDLLKWLWQSDILDRSEPRFLLADILSSLNLPCTVEGLGALRMWGQTGERPTVWIAAADPVYLEPRLDRLFVHAQDHLSVPVSDLRPLIDHLQATLGADDDRYGFARLGTCAYLRASKPIMTADVPSAVVDHQAPDEFLPTGENAAAYRALISELEMALHEHPVNIRRQERQLPPVNSFWLWGGGFAPEQTTVPQPPLFSDDPLLTGHWLSRTAVALKWPGSISACVEASLAGFVAVAPETDDSGLLEQCLSELRELLHTGRISTLQLLFRDGVAARVERGHRWRVWRRASPLLD